MSHPAAPPESPPAPRCDAPVHPLAAALLVFVDNLWMLADWNAVTWFLTIPLSFLSVSIATTFIQRWLHRDTWGRSLGKGLLLGVLAGVPTSVTGTPVGVALLTWAGIMRAKGASASPAIPIAAQVMSVNSSVPPPLSAASAPPPTAPLPPRQIEPWWVKLAIVLLLCGTILFATKMVLDRLDGIAGKFRRQHITETFLSALPTLARTAGGSLELATAKATETITRADDRTIAWDLIYLGRTISEISVPVTYRYHLNLRDPWKLDVVGNTCVVYAPPIRPSLPPAIHTDQMQKRSEAGWARFDTREQMAELERSLTPRLSRTAADPRRLAQVREACRNTAAEFIRDWLLREEHWRGDRFTNIKVIFADEPDVKPELAPPVINLR